MSQNFPLDSCFRLILRFSMFKASVDLPQLLWLYALILRTPLDFHSEARFHLLITQKIVTTQSNQYKKVSFVRVDEDGALARSYEFMKTCHNTNIVVQNTGGDTFSINGNIETPDKALANTTRALLLKSNHKK